MALMPRNSSLIALAALVLVSGCAGISIPGAGSASADPPIPPSTVTGGGSRTAEGGSAQSRAQPAVASSSIGASASAGASTSAGTSVASSANSSGRLAAGSVGRHENLIDRITAGFAMPELDSALVAQHERWIVRNPDYLGRVLERGGKYLHHIVEELEARRMPTELALLPIVESAFNPQALSRAKAAGLWQFIPSTGRAFELKQDWWRDERRDVIESTRAALDYLQKIYELQDNDWFLALASYNWGENGVTRARKANEARGLATDYLSLKMPKETRQYVPKLIALRNVLARPDSFGIVVPFIENKPYFVVIDKEQSIDLKLAAAFADMTVKEFTELNPSHHRPVISASRTNRIILPAEKAPRFQERLAHHISLGEPLVTWQPYTLKPKETLASLAKRTGVTTQDLLLANSLKKNAQPLPGTILLAPISARADDDQIEKNLAKFSGTRVIEKERTEPLYHRVRKNETLASIAKRYGISAERLRTLNKLEGEATLGQRLLIRPAQTRTVMTNEQGVKQVIATPAPAVDSGSPAKP